MISAACADKKTHQPGPPTLTNRVVGLVGVALHRYNRWKHPWLQDPDTALSVSEDEMGGPAALQ